MPLVSKCLSLFVDIMSPRRGRGRPRRMHVDEEASLAFHAPLPQDDPSIPPEFLIPPMPQTRFFPRMTHEVF